MTNKESFVQDAAVAVSSADLDAIPAPNRREELIAGARAMTPFLVSAFPMGLLGGAFGMTSGLGEAKTLALAMVLNSGTVQFIAIKLLQQDAAASVLLLTGLVLSLRLLIYSTVLRSSTRYLSQRWRAVLAFGMIDAVFFVMLDRFKKKQDAYPGWQWFYCGASLAMYLNWMVATVIGIAIGASLPDLIQHGLDFPMIAVFVAMLASTLVNWKVWAIVSCAGVIALLFVGLPYNLGLLVATVAGAAMGVLCEVLEKRRAKEV
ncbi:MAG TPA: AzlC family ABC transporter permease [Pseudomonas sp.]|nr:AzlC family ABC transporter permease [Pseudomonas sp.]